jgi:hypothetical protein
MFNGCTRLNYVKCLATNASTTSYVNSWLNGVSSTGTFYKKAGTSWSSGASGIPAGWETKEVEV